MAEATLDDIIRDWAAHHGEPRVITAPPTPDWAFLHPLVPPLPAGSLVVRIDDLHEAFINRQTSSTRLVTTQGSYLTQVWVDAIGNRSDVLLVATVDRDALRTFAPELVKREPESPWRLVSAETRATGDHTLSILARAMRATDPAERLSLCLQALDHGRTPPALLAAASTCMEVNDLDAAARDLDEALAQAPEWAAAHFERGKLWLRVDDMEHASDSFRHAAQRMPSLTAAWANLGATLGELDRADEALAAFEHALAQDPENHQTLNNIGVVTRELGRLAESESACRTVVTLVPDLAFGHYNLGHTLFLQGRYQAALSAYGEGQRRDPERNPVQATRLAMCRLATGDAAGALRDLQQAVRPLPRDYKQQLLADTHTIAWALLTHKPDLAGWATINDWLTAEMGKMRS